MKRLVLIDAHAVIHRAFHALPPLTGPGGEPTNAIYGFASILLKMLKDLRPDFAAAAFDHAGPTFRHTAFERYKANRSETPGDLSRQFGPIKELVAAFGIPAIEKQGFEADDIIGTIARIVREKHRGVEVVIVTGDLDTLQLVDEQVKVFTMRKGVTDTVLYDARMVKERYGLTPAKLIDFKALRGDPSDNIPGVKGIGEKTAADLLKRHGSIDEIYKRVKKGDLEAKPGIIAALKHHEADALFSKTLATIDVRVPIEFALAGARRRGFDPAPARAFFERYGFQSLIRRLGEEGREAAEAVSAAQSAPIRKTRVRALAAVPAAGHVCIFENEKQRGLIVATAPDAVWEVPNTPSAYKNAGAWFKARTVYAFDLKSLYHAGLPPDLGPVRDLKIIWFLTDPGRRLYDPRSLLAKERRFALAKDEDPARIAALVHAIAPELEARLRAEELSRLYEEMDVPLVPILWAMEARGIGLDPGPLKKLSREMEADIRKIEADIRAAAGADFNINSPRQLSEILFQKLGLEARGVRKTEKSGAVSTRESELVKLSGLNPIVDLVLAYRERTKLKSTFVDALPKEVKKDGRIHTRWNQTGTATGRLSSDHPNLQNIPIRGRYGKEIRRAFVADPGFELVALDYSQLELRIAADLSKDPKMVEAFQRGDDIHKITAAAVNRVPPEKVTPEMRYRAKALNFGILYGMGARAFSESAGISRDEAQHFIEEYFENFSGIKKYFDGVREFARLHGFTKTFFGHKRWYPEIMSTNFRAQREAERMAMNHPVQGTEADIMKRAMIAAARYLADEHLEDRARMLLQIHDELLFEVNKDLPGAVIDSIRGIMQGAWSGAVPMKVEVKRGKNWGELE